METVDLTGLLTGDITTGMVIRVSIAIGIHLTAAMAGVVDMEVSTVATIQATGMATTPVLTTAMAQAEVALIHTVPAIQ